MSRLFTRAEVAGRTGKDDVAIIIDNVVFGVARWLDDHPGGPEVLMANAGKDASKCFHDIGHSEEAKLLRTKYRIGEVVEADRWEVARPTPLSPPSGAESSGAEPAGAQLDVWGPPLLLAALAAILYWYLFL